MLGHGKFLRSSFCNLYLLQVFYEQFKFFNNMYFLLVAMSQLIPELRIGYLYTYFAPLVSQWHALADNGYMPGQMHSCGNYSVLCTYSSSQKNLCVLIVSPVYHGIISPVSMQWCHYTRIPECALFSVKCRT